MTTNVSETANMPMREEVARTVYESAGFDYDGRAISREGKPYGAWLAAVNAADAILARFAPALAAAEKRGMERAAEIARTRIVGGHMHGSPEWPDGDNIALAILAEMEKM